MPPFDSDMQRPTAIVVGIDDFRGVYAARTLARHRVPVIGIATDAKSYGARTRVCQRIISGVRSDQLIDTLVELGPKLESKGIVFPCNDDSVAKLSRQRDRLADRYAIGLPAPETVQLLGDKLRFYEHAHQNNFPVPETRLLSTKQEAEQAAREISYPSVLKPPDSGSERWVRKTLLKAIKIESRDDLLSNYDQYSPHADVLILQRWIEGDDSDHYTCNCYLDRDARPLVTFVSRKLRQWPPLTGNGCLNEECRDDEVVKTTLKLFQQLQFHGLGEVEFKHDALTGKKLIVEPNVGRATGRCALAEGSGVELLYTMYCDLAGLPLPIEREQRFLGTKWIYLQRDFMSALYYWRRGEISLTEWFGSLRGPRVYALLSWKDPLPFIADLYRVAKLLLSRAERRKRTGAKHNVPDNDRRSA